MRQELIRELLTEAGLGDCSPQRLNDIQTALGRAIVAGTGAEYVVESPEAGIGIVFHCLFVETATHRPEAFLDLVPAFLMLCGDREEGEVAVIDWSVVEGQP